MSLDVMKMIYFSYVHSVISYDIILGGNSHFSGIFKIKKKIIIITNAGRRDSCRQLYKQLQILPLPSQYIFSHYLFLSTKIACFYLILKFMIKICISTIIYICLLKISHWCRREFCILEVRLPLLTIRY
jgi:hypothetical protein